MTIVLYQNSSDSNVMHKNLEVVETLTGALKDSCSVTDPVVLVEGDNFANINYMKIEEFNRFYFVNNITSVKNGLWSISGHVDVLTTYANELISIGAIIGRTEDIRYSNLYLDDEKLMVTCRRDFSIIPFPRRVETGSSQFVFTVAGSSGDAIT